MQYTPSANCTLLLDEEVQVSGITLKWGVSVRLSAVYFAWWAQYQDVQHET